jgi:hypothetical protein
MNLRRMKKSKVPMPIEISYLLIPTLVKHWIKYCMLYSQSMHTLEEKYVRIWYEKKFYSIKSGRSHVEKNLLFFIIFL